jgi:D-sedoheptulose 7-phosphate isomerase
MKEQAQELHERAKAHIVVSAETKQQVADRCLGSIVSAAELIADTLKSGRKVLLCGNGGSAADCQHLATEFVSTLTQEFKRPGLRAIALSTDTSFLTAYSNDYGFEGVFARQVEALGVPGDCLIGISTSGSSKNIIRAVEAAKTVNMRTIVLTGSGGSLRSMGDVVISVPATSTQHIQEAHIMIGHVLCGLAEHILFGGKTQGDAL